MNFTPNSNEAPYFSFVIDVFSRRIVGWQLASHMRTTLVLDALRIDVLPGRVDALGRWD